MSTTLVVAGWVPTEPKLGQTKTGKSKAEFSVCAFGPRDQEIWIRVMALENRLEKVVSIIKPGTRLVVSGSLGVPRAYVDKDQVPQCDLVLFASAISLLPIYEPKKGPKSGSPEERLEKQMTDKTDIEEIPF